MICLVGLANITVRVILESDTFCLCIFCKMLMWSITKVLFQGHSFTFITRKRGEVVMKVFSRKKEPVNRVLLSVNTLEILLVWWCFLRQESICK